MISKLEIESGMDLDWLRAAMADKGISQRKLAERVGMSESAMSKVLSGDRELKAGEADAIRRALGYMLPEDLKPGSIERRIIDLTADLDEREKTALVLYLEALGRRALR
jgi:transcriptional regulator with XRE-family HTH domain